MRRTPIVLAATLAGVAGTLGFKAQEQTPTTTAAVSSTDTGTATPSSGSTSSSTSSSSGSSGSGTETASSTGTKTVSSTAQTMYGDVQLRVTIKDGTVTAIENVALPANDPHSSQISTWAGPTLQQSALSHADGTVDAVSGATYTSNGYAQALQSALDQAGTATTASSSSSSSS